MQFSEFTIEGNTDLFDAVMLAIKYFQPFIHCYIFNSSFIFTFIPSLFLSISLILLFYIPVFGERGKSPFAVFLSLSNHIVLLQIHNYLSPINAKVGFNQLTVSAEIDSS